MSLYQKLYNEVVGILGAEDADYLAESLSAMSQNEVRRIFKIVDEYEPSEVEQGLIPIPAGYAEQ